MKVPVTVDSEKLIRALASFAMAAKDGIEGMKDGTGGIVTNAMGTQQRKAVSRLFKLVGLVAPNRDEQCRCFLG